MLPFVIRYISGVDKEYPVQVSTVEYKGWKRSQVDTGYKAERVIEMLTSGFLIEAAQVKKSYVLERDQHLLPAATRKL